MADTLRGHGLYATGIQVHIRTASLNVKEYSRTYPDSTNSAYEIASRGIELLKENYNFSEPLRSVGIRAIGLKEYETAVQQDIFGDCKRKENQEKIENSIYELRKKFGNSSISRASAEKE